MMKRNLILLLLFAVFLASPILATAQNVQSPASFPEPTGSLIVALGDMSDIFDPGRVVNNHKFYMLLVFETLVGADHNGQIKPSMGLAEKWEMSSDAKTWTFHLRKGIKFHNGDAVTAADVKFSIDRVTNPKSIMTYAGMFRNLIDRVEVVNPSIVRIYLKRPSTDLHRMLGPESSEGIVLPKKYIEEKGDVYFGLHPVGTGPFKVVEIIGGSQITMEAANKQHWLHGAAKYKNLIFKLMPEELTRIGSLKTGAVDIIMIGAERIEGIKAAGFNVLLDPAAAIAFIAPTEQWRAESPISNKKVRQALALAINREEVLKHVFYGLGRLSASISSIRGAFGYQDLPIYPYDPEKAKQLLKEAGYPNGFKLKIHSYPTSMFPSLPRTMEVMAAYLAKIGVTAEIVPYADYQSFRPKFYAHELESGLMGNDTQGRNDPLRGIHLWYHSSAGVHLSESPEVDALINKAQSTLNEAERMALIQKLERYGNDNYTFLFAVERPIAYAISKKLEPWDMGTLVLDINLEKVLMWNSPK